MDKPTADRAGRDPGDDQHRGIAHACLPCARAAIATKVCILLPALVNAVPVCFLHYSIVWVVIEGVDVVADNPGRLLVSLRTGLCALLMVAVAALLAATPQAGMCCLRKQRHRRRFVSRSTRRPDT
jgi:hypothetical protein